MKRFGIVLGMLVCMNCTDAFFANVKSYGAEHHVRMYNDGVLVAEWYSTGKVASIKDSDGWEFMDKETKQLVRVGGDVIIEVAKN